MLRVTKFVQRTLIIGIAGCCAATFALPAFAERGPIFPGIARSPQVSEKISASNQPSQLTIDQVAPQDRMPPHMQGPKAKSAPQKMVGQQADLPVGQSQRPSLQRPPQMANTRDRMPPPPPRGIVPPQPPQMSPDASDQPPILQNQQKFEAPKVQGPPQRMRQGPPMPPQEMRQGQGPQSFSPPQGMRQRPPAAPGGPGFNVRPPQERPFKLEPSRNTPPLPERPLETFRAQQQPKQMIGTGSDARRRIHKNNEKQDVASPQAKRPAAKPIQRIDPTGPSSAKDMESPHSRMKARNRRINSSHIQPGVGVADRSMPARAKAKSQGLPFGTLEDEIIQPPASKMNSRDYRTDTERRAEERAQRRLGY